MRSCVVLTPHEKKECSLPGTTSTQQALGPFYHSTIVAATALQHYIPWTGAKKCPSPPDLDLEVYIFFFLYVFTVPLEIEMST